MDNLFELLIFFFVIYSILTPILNKKKRQNTERKVPQRYPGDVKKNTPPQPSPRDIFEEMLGFKIPKSEDEYRNPVPPSSRSNNSEMPSIDYDTDLKVEYEDLETDRKMPDIDFDKLTSTQIEEIKKKEEAQQSLGIYKSAKSLNKKTIEIKQKLSNPSSFREIFLMSEILNKPKALRR